MRPLRRLFQRLGWLTTGGMFALLIGGLSILVAQQPTIGIFSRIYLGGTASSNPQIRWGAAAPSGACTPGTFYLQNTSPAAGTGVPVWFCKATSNWQQVASETQLGNTFYANASTYGATCNGTTDDTVAIQGAVDAAFLWGKAGDVELPPGICKAHTIVFGPITNPWQVTSADPLFLQNVGFQFNAPRAATIVYTAGSSTITWAGTVITSADIGNFVFYGPADAEYTAVGVTRVTRPIYGCTVTALLSSTSATCVASDLVVSVGVPLAATTGSHASFITDDHNVTINNAIFNATPAAFAAGHVGKSMTFTLPNIRAPLFFDNSLRPGSHTTLEASPSPCTGTLSTDDWQCYLSNFFTTMYFTATITSVTDATHAKMSITGLSPGSKPVTAFPDYPVHAGANSECGGSDPNCASLPAHEWAHLVPADSMLIGRNPHISHTVDTTISSAYNQATNSHSYLGILYPYSQPVDTSARFMSLHGASHAGTTLSFTGCSGAQWANACAALIFSRNKYFRVSDLSVSNASGSNPDDTTQIGVYFGGLPGGGTQALDFDVARVGVAGFGTCVQIGDDLGGEASDGNFHMLAVSNCGYGVRVGPGSANTLDINFSDLQGGFNKVGFANYEGNIFLDKGSFSFNDIDIISLGFGPFAMKNMRTEGPGIFFIGADPGTSIENNDIAQAQASRAITGNVTATPNGTHNVTGVDVSATSTGSPAGSFYPITFSPSDITVDDLRKITVIPGVGVSGHDVVAQIWSVLSTTTGTVFVSQSGSIVSHGAGVTLPIYDNNLADLTFPTDTLTQGDLGASLALPTASVPFAWNTAVHCVVTKVTTATTGQCGFFLGNQGAGPVKPGGGTSANPYLLVNIGAYLTATDNVLFNSNIFASARIWVDTPQSGSGGELSLLTNQTFSVTGNPVTYSGSGKYYQLAINPVSVDMTLLPVPTSDLGGNVGLVFPWNLIDMTNQGYNGVISVLSHGNTSRIYGGLVPWHFPNGVFTNVLNVDERFQNIDTGLLNFDTFTNPFVPSIVNSAAPITPTQQLTRIKTLSEAGYVNGKNLRLPCTFATSDTVICNFLRTTEAYEVRRGVSTPTSYDPVTRTYGVNVTTGHFTQADVGKQITFPACCAGETVYAYVVGITSSTVITVRLIAGVSASFPTGITTGNARVGVSEPDALWLPALWGCSANETIWINSHTADGVTLKSSNASSTASCLVGVIR